MAVHVQFSETVRFPFGAGSMANIVSYCRDSPLATDGIRQVFSSQQVSYGFEIGELSVEALGRDDLLLIAKLCRQLFEESVRNWDGDRSMDPRLVFDRYPVFAEQAELAAALRNSA